LELQTIESIFFLRSTRRIYHTSTNATNKLTHFKRVPYHK